jgi:hypothetical protein
MQRWTRNGMLNFSQPSASSPFGFSYERPGNVDEQPRAVARLPGAGQGAAEPGEEPEQGAQGVDEGEGGDGVRAAVERAPQ